MAPGTNSIHHTMTCEQPFDFFNTIKVKNFLQIVREFEFSIYIITVTVPSPNYLKKAFQKNNSINFKETYPEMDCDRHDMTFHVSNMVWN
jgi:hypothetical protein